VPKPSMRTELIQVGLSEFRVRGYSATGVQAITDRAGAPRGSFYGHFASKEAFAVEVLDYYEQWYIAAVDNPELRGVSRLRYEFGLLLQIGRELKADNGCLWGMFGAEVGALTPRLGQAVNEAVNRWAERLGGYLADAYTHAGRTAPDTVALAHHLIGAWEGALWRSRLSETTQPLDLFAAHTLEPVLAAAEALSPSRRPH
jgi:TetR/AcrR family transcriptional repressor of nem operon